MMSIITNAQGIDDERYVDRGGAEAAVGRQVEPVPRGELELLNSLAVVLPGEPPDQSMQKARRTREYEPPIADRAMRRTPSFPSRLPKTPFTNAPIGAAPG